MLTVKRIVYILLIAAVLLSGCSKPLKKITTPDQGQNTTENKGQDAVQKPGTEAIKPGTQETKPNPDPAPAKEPDKTQVGEKPAEQTAQASGLIMVNGKATVMNPSDLLVLVNKTRNLPSDYVPNDIVSAKVSGNNTKMRKTAAAALEELFSGALKDGIKLFAASGYRSYDSQMSVFNNSVKRNGEEATRMSVAVPGQSEHQTGLAMDVSCASMNYDLLESFGETKEGKWLKEHAKDYGFIIRYQKEKVSITGYSYEPWHIRYVGKTAANFIMSNNITFEEYFNTASR